MASEIIYVCKSINNKNVREGELEILRKYQDSLYFEFGESEMNIKRRFYKDAETLNKDYNALMMIKNGEAKTMIEEPKVEEVIEEIEEKVEPVEEPKIEEEPPRKFKKRSKFSF
jgi:hypothetical protein